MFRKIQIESRQSNLRIVEKMIDEITSELGISQDCYGKIMVSAMEGVNNAIIHGNKMIPEKMVGIEIEYKNKMLKIKISDEGSGFKPEEVPDPTAHENIESLNGRGVFLMTRLADKIKYSKKGNAVTMTFKNILVEC
jgi:serine/threonine-protein kinase RsbW